MSVIRWQKVPVPREAQAAVTRTLRIGRALRELPRICGWVRLRDVLRTLAQIETDDAS